MLTTLNIRNYRNLRNLKIKSLSRVNLFVGKNNTGKSSILEAVAIYASKGDYNIINQILSDRGEETRRGEAGISTTESNIKIFSSLFTNRETNFDPKCALEIGPADYDTPNVPEKAEKSVSLQFVRYYDDVEKNENGQIIRQRKILTDNNPSTIYQIALQVSYGNNTMLLPLEEDRPFRFGYRNFGEKDNFQYIRTRNIDRDTNGKLWDNVTLTEKEIHVIDALKIIEPDTERIAYIEEAPRERIAVIKTSSSNGVVPLRSMGDGINRVLTIILGLVNCDNGYLLLDEFENGLHHTVQEQLWKVIFELAERLNIQVFATTHSNDCIAAFEKVLNSTSNNYSGKLIRLENRNGEIVQIEFSPEELKIAQNLDIETR